MNAPPLFVPKFSELIANDLARDTQVILGEISSRYVDNPLLKQALVFDAIDLAGSGALYAGQTLAGGVGAFLRKAVNTARGEKGKNTARFQIQQLKRKLQHDRNILRMQQEAYNKAMPYQYVETKLKEKAKYERSPAWLRNPSGNPKHKAVDPQPHLQIKGAALKLSSLFNDSVRHEENEK